MEKGLMLPKEEKAQYKSKAVTALQPLGLKIPVGSFTLATLMCASAQ